MQGYALLPPAVSDDDTALRHWVDRAIDYGATLPPKASKTPKTPKTRVND
jgi:hypothetical protein